MVITDKKVLLTNLEEKLSKKEIDTHILPSFRLIYFCNKIQKTLQDIINVKLISNITYDVFLEKPYEDLLLYCLMCLKVNNTPLENVLSPTIDKLDDGEIYTLSEYSVKKYDNPLETIDDTDFKRVLKSIITDVSESVYFYRIIRKEPWN